MTVLVTGGAGFIGSALCKELAARGKKVVIFDIKSDDTLAENLRDKATFIKGDISNWPEVLNVVQSYQIKYIFHLAALLSAPSEANPWACLNINVLGTFHVLEAARLFQVKQVIFTSSMGVYSVGRETVVTDETIQKPTIIYGIAKTFGELLGLYYHKRFGIDFRGVRFPQLIGPGVKSAGFGQYNPKIIEAAIRGEPFEVWVPEDTILPLMYVKDAVRSLIMLHEAPEERIRTRIYNLGQITPPPTAKDLVNAVKKYYPNAQISFRPDPRTMEILKSIPKQISGQRAEEEWGWKISYSLDEAVKDFIEEFRSSR